MDAEAGFSLGAINLASERLAARDPQDRVVKSRLFRAYMVGRRFPEAERLIDSMMEQTWARQKRAERISFLQKTAETRF